MREEFRRAKAIKKAEENAALERKVMLEFLAWFLRITFVLELYCGYRAYTIVCMFPCQEREQGVHVDVTQLEITTDLALVITKLPGEVMFCQEMFKKFKLM